MKITRKSFIASLFGSAFLKKPVSALPQVFPAPSLAAGASMYYRKRVLSQLQSKFRFHSVAHPYISYDLVK